MFIPEHATSSTDIIVLYMLRMSLVFFVKIHVGLLDWYKLKRDTFR